MYIYVRIYTYICLSSFCLIYTSFSLDYIPVLDEYLIFVFK